MNYNSATQTWDASSSPLATAPNYTNNPIATGDMSGATQVVNTNNTAPAIVSNYNTQKKVGDITSTFQNHANTAVPSFPTGTNRAVYAPSGDGTTGEFLGYAGTPEQEQQMLSSYQTKDQTSFGTNFNAPQGAQVQPDGTYLYQGQYYTKDQLASPENLAAISNTTTQQKKYDDALASELDAINKRFDMYRQQQQQVTQSGAAGAQNALLQSGAGGRGSVAQYAAVTADARVNSIMQDGQRALQELDSKRSQLLSAAKIAYQDKNYKLLGDLNAQITKNRDDMLASSRKANEALTLATDQAKKDTAISSIYDSGITDPSQILAKLQSQGIKNITAKDITSTIETLNNQKGIDEIRLKIAEAGNDPSIINGATSVEDAIIKAGKLLAKPNEEVIKVGNTAYIYDKNQNKIIKTLGTATGGAGVAGKGSGVAETIIASGKFTAQQATNIRNAINNGEDPATVIRNQAKGLLTSANQTKVEGYEAAKTSMQDLKSALNTYYTNGGKTDIFSGNFEKVINKLGTVNDPKLVEVATQIAAQLQVYRNAVSGTAYSVQEGQEMGAIFPGINKTQGLNDAIINGRLKAFDSTIDGAYRSVLGSGYDQIKKIEADSQPKSIPKGTMDDRTYVEKVLSSQNIPYDTIVNATPKGKIPVVDNKTGQTGHIEIELYQQNPSAYTKI